MRGFHCDHCGHLLFFENISCVHCGRLVAYLPDLGVVGSLEPDADGMWRSPLPRARDRRLRLCRNYEKEQVCNWTVRADTASPLCTSCRLTRVIPTLDHAANRYAWYRLEVAKRRLIYTLLELGLPVCNREDDPEHGLAFEFKAADPSGGPGQPVLTGHADGVITINVAEVDDAERERRRTTMHEPYRTLLGHMRHEIGHYYWDLLIGDSANLDEFRSFFGDERRDYAAALKEHYTSGAPADWQARFVSAYASAHPWEDWAETWAHYLHMVDTLETAAACGLTLTPARKDEPALVEAPPPITAPARFDHLLDSWFSVTYVLNNLNRGLGLADAYPFVLSPPAIAKLRFVDQVVGRAKASPQARAEVRTLPSTSR